MTKRGTPSPLVHFQPGELIFAAGEQGCQAYIIDSGQVDIFVTTDGEPSSLRILTEGAVFGEMAVIDDAPRSASARAITETSCVVVSSGQISERIEESDPVVKLLVSTLLTRMRSITPGASPSSLSGSTIAPLIESAKASDSFHRQSVLDKMRLESELREAIATEAFTPYYQALVDIETGDIWGFECLIRWQSPTRGHVSPALFINTAEETSLILPIGRWILEKACQDINRFNQILETTFPDGLSSRKPFFISVNVSARQFQSPQFLEDLVSIIGEYNIACSQIKLEVTERVLMEGDVGVDAIQKCRGMGFHISLDDFGTGFSSLSYIARFEIDSLKIDQCFVRQMLTNERTLELIKTIIAMTKGLGMTSFAEGIETQEQLERLRELGCEIGQGYLFSKPIPFEAAEQLLLENYRRH